MKRILNLSLIYMLIIGLMVSIATPALADNNDDVVNEKLGDPIIVYGDTLTNEQKEETRKLLGVTNPEAVTEYTVDGSDISRYIDGDPNSRMFSSAKITREESGKGLTIDIVTPEDITQVTSEMYANALLTAGVEDATVEVASPVKVTGHSALSGIYKAYDEEGVELDKDRMELANEELDVATDLADKEDLNEEEVTNLLAEIKKEIAEQDPATKEDVERIVKEQLDKLEINLSDEDRQLLTDLFEKMRDLDIDFDKVKDQLNDIASKVQDKLEGLLEDEGFQQKVKSFFERMINFLKNIFN